MPGIFGDYQIVLLDIAPHAEPYTQEVKDGLRQAMVCVAGTLKTEAESYKAVLPDNEKWVYQANISFLEQNVRLNVLGFQGERNAKNIHDDTWGMLTVLLQKKVRFVVVTANELLLQRIVVNLLPVDIYALKQNTFLKAASFPSLKDKYELNSYTAVHPLNLQGKALPGDRLFSTDGSSVVLGQEIGSGLEGTLFRTKKPTGQVVKVFRRGTLSVDKYMNIQMLMLLRKSFHPSWAVFPSENIHFGGPGGELAGFLEAYVQTGQCLDQNPLYIGALEELEDEQLDTKLSANVEICRQIVRQVCYLNSYGLFLSDFNPRNFAETGNGTIQMWDTDSFGYGQYSSGNYAPYFIERPVVSNGIQSRKGAAIEMGFDALYQFIFFLLSLGMEPISEKTKEFRFDDLTVIEAYGYRRCLIPENLWYLFEEVFRGKKAPSPQILQQQLDYAARELREKPWMDKRYRELLSDVLEMQRMREEQERAEGERAECERLEAARQEAEREKAEREAAERAARQKAEREKAEREAAERAARQKTEREKAKSEKKSSGSRKWLWILLAAFFAIIMAVISIGTGAAIHLSAYAAQQRMVGPAGSASPLTQIVMFPQEAEDEADVGEGNLCFSTGVNNEYGGNARDVDRSKCEAPSHCLLSGCVPVHGPGEGGWLFLHGSAEQRGGRPFERPSEGC